ncbi:hypothetical protein R3P38DRAFT_3236086 [Favolaschia claudopus]|uniref:Uncharacterized protein n=1 Tax=Favolaschia claudopus TaxID=2862362 RepID=A0AAV9ZCV3_9AGAR
MKSVRDRRMRIQIPVYAASYTAIYAENKLYQEHLGYQRFQVVSFRRWGPHEVTCWATEASQKRVAASQVEKVEMLVYSTSPWKATTSTPPI